MTPRLKEQQLLFLVYDLNRRFIVLFTHAAHYHVYLSLFISQKPSLYFILFRFIRGTMVTYLHY